MTEKELRKLHRQDLLELLVEQSREASRLSAALDEKEQECREITENNERLKAKLDEKDAGLAQHTAASGEQLESLKGKLDEKDAQMEKLKGRLDEKDAQIEKLKPRLDEKDARIEKLTARLNEKDPRIEKLIGRLNEKDARIGQLTVEIEQYRSGEILGFEGDPSIDEVGQKLNAVLRAAQKAVAQYLDGARAAGSQVAPLPTDMQGQPSKESLPEPADSRPEPSEEQAGEGQQGQEERI